jgi:hypothetical protein
MNRFSKSLALIILGSLILAGWFYWFEYRPAKIRQDCSWTKHIISAQPVQPAVTKEDVAQAHREYEDCKDKSNKNNTLGGAWWCDLNLKNASQYESPEIPAKPESSYYGEAEGNEYDFCIHEKGLK